VAVLVTAVSSWLAYARVSRAFEREFTQGLLRIAVTGASEIEPRDLEPIRELGDESSAYGLVQVQLATLRAAVGIHDAALIDSSGITLVQSLDPEGSERLPADLDSLGGGALATGLSGSAVVSEPYRRPARTLRAAFAPIREAGGAVVGVIAVEAETPYREALAGLAGSLGLITAISLLAIGLLAVLILRAAVSATRLERRLSRLENLAAMGRLTATLAHEIKNPLAIIRGSAQRLGKLEPEAGRMAQFVIEEVDRLGRTVERYLQFARGDAEIREVGDAVEALDETVGLLEGEFKARRLRVERSGPRPGPSLVPLDKESLKQVYLNLILNALDALPEGGRLGIEHGERHGRVEVSIVDDGPGIPEDVLKRIGSPFYTTKAKGSGLGLFLTRRLVEACGGELEIRSQAGQGTACTVRFPRAKG
jgi:signal transduction histidine kinase